MTTAFVLSGGASLGAVQVDIDGRDLIDGGLVNNAPRVAQLQRHAST